jgi:glutathione S-transferase
MTSITFWGLTASPYQLKMQSIPDFAEQSWRKDLAAMEQLLTRQPFLLGQRFTRGEAL